MWMKWIKMRMDTRLMSFAVCGKKVETSLKGIMRHIFSDFSLKIKNIIF